ncbi:unnamed protein product [Gongylonema pulchrum]|uniref:7TM_GPCR_Srx domain-containing protein n=1 Tax=Gongylonema pulchrum TaxID=637853 RepID=A0A183DIK7_9BILA|nr:unnamed protein product [Gongylonema pulchrum]
MYIGFSGTATCLFNTVSYLWYQTVCCTTKVIVRTKVIIMYGTSL